MITNYELNYAHSRPQDAPFPGFDYAYQTMNELIVSIQKFNEAYLNKKHVIILSNGEEITFEINEKNLAHLLGIDLKNLSSNKMAPFCEGLLGIPRNERFTSYEILQRIIQRGEDVIKNDSKYPNYKILNYFKIMIKSITFEKMPSFNACDFSCINFDREIHKRNGSKDMIGQASKFFFVPSDENIAPYFMMGIKRVKINDYAPETILAPVNFAEFFKNQELLMPVQVLTSIGDKVTRIEATNQEKLKLLNMYKFIINYYQTNSFVNIYNDYENILKEKILEKTR